MKKVSFKDYTQFMLDQGLIYNSYDEYDNNLQRNGWVFKHGQYTFYLVDLTEPCKPSEINQLITEEDEYAAKKPKNFEEFKTMLIESIKDLKTYVNQIDINKIKEDF